MKNLYVTQLYIDDVLFESRWKELLRLGKLSKNAVRSIQKLQQNADPLYVKKLLKDGKKEQAQNYLKKKGIVKSCRDWLQSVEKGTNEILRKSNVKKQHMAGKTFTKTLELSGVDPKILKKDMGLEFGKPIENIVGTHTQVSPKGRITAHVTSSKYINQKDRVSAGIIKRHEADEARIARKMFNKNRQVVASSAGGGAHMTDEVLKKEKELVNVQNALYGKKFSKSKKLLSKIRKLNGEYEIAGTQTAKDIKKRQKQVLELVKKQQDDIKFYNPEDKKELKKQLSQLFGKSDIKSIRSRLGL